MSIGFVAGGGSTEIQTNQIQANSGKVSTERKADSVVRSIINLLIDNALAASGDAFFNAAKRGRIEVVDTLLKGEPIDKFYLSKALHSAAENGHTEIIKRLLLNGRINDEDRGIAMQNAAKNGHTEIIRRLLRNGPISDEDRGLALEDAARNGQIHIIEMLLEGGARIPQHHLNEAVWLLNIRGLAFPALNALVVNAPLANNYGHGVNVHNGLRDDKTRAALELLWKHTDAGKIEEHFRSCLSYLEGLPKSDKKTLALKALFGPKEAFDNFPPLLDKESFSCTGFSLTGKELIGRLWEFISGCDKNNQDECKEGILTALSTSFEHGSLVCNQGKTQRLLIAVLQGRLEGVQIDDLAPVLSPDHALALFFRDERRQNINDKEELLAEANRFLQLNPGVQRESFMAKLEEYWNLRDEAQ